MVDLSVKKLGLINPFVVASSPATQGTRNVLKTAKMRPGAITMRNFGHGAGGGSYFNPGFNEVILGGHASHSHAVGRQIEDPITTLEQYCEEVKKTRSMLDSDIKLWVSVGHYGDFVKGGNWEADWTLQAHELTLAGADALELHFNTPGVAIAKDRIFDYYQLVRHSTELIKKAEPNIPLMVKLTTEGCDVLTSMRIAQAAGADAVGPTSRWKAFCMDLDWRTTHARPGSGYGGTQATPIVCQAIAEGRNSGIDLPIYAGGGVFSFEQAARLIMAGSDCVQLGTIACSGGVGVCKKLISDFEKWMETAGYESVEQLQGDALTLYNMPSSFAKERQNTLADEYKNTPIITEKCIGCGRCDDVCWNDAIAITDKIAVKTEKCIGCGYCYQVCPTGALYVPSGEILAKAFQK
ncbi:MAG: 4Fe-4S binding protein [Clostridia bacterium]